MSHPTATFCICVAAPDNRRAATNRRKSRDRKAAHPAPENLCPMPLFRGRCGARQPLCAAIVLATRVGDLTHSAVGRGKGSLYFVLDMFSVLCFNPSSRPARV